MSIEENKELVQRFIEEVFNAGNTAAIADFTVPGSLLTGGLASQIMGMRTALPDTRFTIDEMVAEADKVVARVTQRGTNTGPLVGLPAFGKLELPVPPTGRPVMVTSIHIFKIKDGKVVSTTAEIDQIGLLQQLGWSITPPDQT
jgi:predicted ester cyclase